MTEDEVIRIAREACMAGSQFLYDSQPNDGPRFIFTVDVLERFANLVAAAERDTWMERAAILIRGEREACAKVCESHEDYPGEHAKAIRARGNT